MNTVAFSSSASVMLALLKTVNHWIEQGFKVFSTISLILFTMIVFLQIIFRNLLNLPMLWSIEIALLCFFWALFLGAAIGLRKRRHYLVEIFPAHWIKTHLFLNCIAHFFVMFLLIIFLKAGTDYALTGFKKLSNSISLAQGFFFIPLPLASVAMLLFSIELLFEDSLVLISSRASKKTNISDNLKITHSVHNSQALHTTIEKRDKDERL